VDIKDRDLGFKNNLGFSWMCFQKILYITGNQFFLADIIIIDVIIGFSQIFDRQKH